MMVEIYREPGLDVYEKVHYANSEHIDEVEQILKWYCRKKTKILDIGCSGGLHALEFAKRGYCVTGLDNEPSAIQRAVSRSRKQALEVCFRVTDIEKDGISNLGKYDLIYSIGNVMSHIRKYSIYNTFRQIKSCLDKEGVFLFNVLIVEPPFQEVIHENHHKITWRRTIEKRTGKISMYAEFPVFNMTQHFSVWGYYINEAREILQASGFGRVDFSKRLDFSTKGSETRNPISLYFRTRNDSL